MMASVHGLWPLLLAQLLVAASGAGLIPLLDALAINGVKTRGLDYGRMRLWGSITFIAGSVVAGVLVDGFGMGLAIWLIIAGAAATAIAGHLLPRPPAIARSKPLSLADAGGLLRSPVFLLFLIGGGALSAAHMLLYIYSVLHWQTQGLSNAWAGVLWGIGVVAEITLFAFAGSWLRGRSPVHVMLIGAVAAVVRWTAMAFDPPLALLIPLQALHGLTFGALHLGAILFMTRAVPEAQAGTGQGLYGVFTAGIGGTLGAWIAGMGYAASGGLAYLWMSALALAGLVALIAVARRWDGSAIAVK
jgi:PPP family 3-phenylpropionic acid transporter